MLDTESNSLFCRTAAYIPIGIDSVKLIAIDKIASDIVGHNRSRILSITFRPSVAIEFPKSNCTNRPIHCTYRT